MYKNFKKFYLAAVLILLAFNSIACSGIFSDDDSASNQPVTIAQKYEYAVTDSMTRSDIYNNLIAIYSTNESLIWDATHTKIAVLSVMKPGRESTYTPAGKQINIQWKAFVTVAPQLKNAIKNSTYTNLNLRVEEFLGVPDAGYNYCVELWVRPSDLFRPSPDPEIDDTVAELTYRPGTPQDHINWLNQHIYESYYSGSKFPFTRLGYTYDWGGTTKFGMSEFVIKTGSTVEVKLPATTFTEYFK